MCVCVWGGRGGGGSLPLYNVPNPGEERGTTGLIFQNITYITFHNLFTFEDPLFCRLKESKQYMNPPSRCLLCFGAYWCSEDFLLSLSDS